MPSYDYRCVDCGCETEIYQSIEEAPLTNCTKCYGKINRIITSACVHFGSFSTKSEYLKSLNASFGKEADKKVAKGYQLLSNDEIKQETDLRKRRKKESFENGFNKFFSEKKREIIQKWTPK